jgi:uncharacterized protein (DUF2147 family)
MKQFYFYLVVALLLSTCPLLAAQSPVGKWKTVDEKSGKVTSDIEIYAQSGVLFGKIVALTDPNDKEGKPKICIACAGTDKDKPIVGLVVLKDFKPSGDRYRGTIMDPQDGKVYTAEIWVEDGNLKVRGYVGFFYQTRTWIKGT